MTNQIRGLAKTFGLTVSAGKGQVFDAPVRGILPNDPVLHDLFENLLSVLSGLKDQRRGFDRRFARFSRADEACRIVSSARGVGSLMAIAFMTAVDDPARSHRRAHLEGRRSIDAQTSVLPSVETR